MGFLLQQLLEIYDFTANSAHFLGYSAVDNMEIRYGGSTIYTTAKTNSINTWNSLNKIYIAPDNVYTVEDVTYRDFSDSGSWISGQHIYRPLLSDIIEFNKYWLNQYTSSQQKDVALHELGHALGLDHSYTPNVMVQGTYSYTQLGSHEKQDYYYLYPYYRRLIYDNQN